MRANVIRMLVLLFALDVFGGCRPVVRRAELPQGKLAKKAGEPETADPNKPARAATTAAQQAPPQAEATLPASECRWADGPIEIDGRSDETAWHAAQPLSHFRLAWLKEKQRPPRTSTEARLLWDEDYLYFFAEMEDGDLYADVTQHDGQTWDNDVFELFFKPLNDDPGYYEFQVNAAGTRMDLFLPRRGSGGYRRFKSTHPFQMDAVVVHRGTLNDYRDRDVGWTVEGRIPWEDFAPCGGKPRQDDVWKFALCRYDYSVDFEGPELSSTAPLERLSFHRHEDYAPLRFVGAAETQSKRPRGIQRRVAWTTSRVVGSPEPPLPYRVEETFQNVKIHQPLAVYPEPGTDNLLVIQHLGPWRGPGKILRIKDDPETDQVDELLSLDRIAYGLAFHPNYEKNGYLYVGSNGPVDSENKKTSVTRYTVDRQPPYACDPDSELLIIDWESDGHNGGDLGFSPEDGCLYVTAGDGTSDSDTNLTGQDISNLCATVMRLDVDNPTQDRPYSVPQDNPFVHLPEARPEIWAFGFRNPWRMSFDPRRGHLWVGQNGQDLWEQVYVVQRGANYGWSVMEGGHPFYPQRQRGPGPILPPTLEHPHSEARSLTGGVVYYGKKLPQLHGAYIYGDWSTGKIWGAKYDGRQVVWHQELADTTLQIGGFGLDHAGELLVIDQGQGGLYRLVETPQDRSNADFPRKLSETGLFASVADHRVAPGVIPYSVNAPQWCDGARQQRYLAIPGEGQIDYRDNRGWNLPNGTVVVKTLSLPVAAQGGESFRRIETQMLVRQQDEWQGYSYAWNREQTDATLVAKEGTEQVVVVADDAAPGGSRQQRWQFVSRSACMACHSRAANYVLGLSTLQFNRSHDYGNVRDQQLQLFEHLGLFHIHALKHEQEIFDAIRRIVRPPRQWAELSFRVLWENLSKIGDRPSAKDADDPRQDHERSASQASLAGAPTRLPQSILLALPDPLPQLVWALQRVPGKIQSRRQRLRKELRESEVFISKLTKHPAQLPHLTDPYDQAQPLAARARSYLHANCAHCHVAAGGGNAQIELELTTAADKMQIFDVQPRHDRFGLPDARLVAPGDPFRSVLWYRIAKSGGGRMPRVGSVEVDRAAVQLIRDWIAQMPRRKGSSSAGAVAAHSGAAKTVGNPEPPMPDEIPSREQFDRARVDQLLADTRGALKLMTAIDRGRLTGQLKDYGLAQARSRGAAVRDLFESYLPLDQRVRRLGSEIRPETILSLQGNADRGRELFLREATVQCRNCHRLGDEGKPLGPDLVEVARKNNRRQLLESLLHPSRKVDEKFTSYQVVTADGKVHTGLVRHRSDEQVVLADAQGKEIRLTTTEIEAMRPSQTSIMPTGLLRDLTAQQAADLLDFLASLKHQGPQSAALSPAAR